MSWSDRSRRSPLGRESGPACRHETQTGRTTLEREREGRENLGEEKEEEEETAKGRT